MAVAGAALVPTLHEIGVGKATSPVLQSSVEQHAYVVPVPTPEIELLGHVDEVAHEYVVVPTNVPVVYVEADFKFYYFFYLK